MLYCRRVITYNERKTKMSEKFETQNGEFKSSFKPPEGRQFELPVDIEGVEAASTKEEADKVLEQIRQKVLEAAAENIADRESGAEAESNIVTDDIIADFEPFFTGQGDFSTDANLTPINISDKFDQPSDLPKIKEEVYKEPTGAKALRLAQAIPFVYPFIKKAA